MSDQSGPRERRSSLDARFETLLARPDAQIPLDETSLVIAAQAQAELDVDAELVYLVKKTIGDNKAALVAAHKGLAKFDPASAWRPELVGLPLHPGAEKYYREKGWMK